MTYLERWRAREISSEAGGGALTKPPKAPSVSSGSALGRTSKNIRGPNADPYAGCGELRPCVLCRNLTARGACLAAWRGDLPNAGKQYHPEQHQPRRCEGYVPSGSDPDQRTGRERWSNLDAAPSKEGDG